MEDYKYLREQVEEASHDWWAHVSPESSREPLASKEENIAALVEAGLLALVDIAESLDTIAQRLDR